MNTLTIAVLVVCATMAYASAIPGVEELRPGLAAQPEAEILQAAESSRYKRGYGGGHYGHGGGHHGHGGGHYGHGGGHYGHGGGHHGHGGHRGGWGK